MKTRAVRSDILWKRLGQRLEEKNAELKTIFQYAGGIRLLRDDVYKPAMQKHLFAPSCLLLRLRTSVLFEFSVVTNALNIFLKRNSIELLSTHKFIC